MSDPTFPGVACTSPPSEAEAAVTAAQADEDRALVARYRQGDREAYTLLVVRYQRPIYQAAFWVLRRAEDARDVAQTVFLKAAEKIADYDPRFKFFSWIYRIAVNEALNVQRRRGHEEELDDDVDIAADPEAGPESRAGAGQRARQLRGALMKLSANDRAVITMRHFHECSYQEMAVSLGVEEKTVKSRLFEARQRLRALLGDLEGAAHGQPVRH